MTNVETPSTTRPRKKLENNQEYRAKAAELNNLEIRDPDRGPKFWREREKIVEAIRNWRSGPTFILTNARRRWRGNRVIPAEDYRPEAKLERAERDDTGKVRKTTLLGIADVEFAALRG